VYIPEVILRIGTVTETIATDMRNDVEYSVDVSRSTKDEHIEHL